MSLSFKIEEHTSGVMNIDLEGKILAGDETDQVQEAIENGLKQQVKLFIIDLSQVTYINSSGLNLFLRLFTKVRNKAGELIYVSPSDTVKQLLAISKLDSIFTICADKEEALNLLNAKKA